MNSKTWQVATFVLALVAVGAGVFAFTQHSAVTDLTAQLAAATADAKQAHDSASSLTAQLAATMKDAEQAHSEAAATAAQATAEQQQLQSTQSQLAAEARPDLPVNLSFRKALLSAGLVGVFRNTSSQELEFVLDLESPATGRHIRKSVVLNPNGFLEIGAQQGWPFAPGQRIMLNNPAYRPRAFTVGPA
jgi:septal ring factor EnvC (AmiA/AmiB activator)